MRVPLAAIALLACAAGATGCPSGDEPPGDGFSREDLERRVRGLYERARGAGEDVPADVYDWAQEDVGRIGDWEYRVVRLEDAGDEVLAERLDELGRDRWEAYWLERRGGGYRVFLKRPARSWLRRLPLSELGRLVPLGGSATD